MAITRTAWIDDDGSGTTGTVINNAEKTLLYDQIDAALVTTETGAAPSMITVATTGTINTLPLPPGRGDLTVLMINAAPATINGIAAGLNGQRLTVLVQNGAVSLSHLSASAGSTAQRLLNFAASAATPLAATVGAGTAAAEYVYDGNYAQLWRMVAHEQGAWITPPFSAANFSGYTGGAVWTVAAGNVTALRYRLSGRSLTLTYALASTTVSGTATSTLAIQNGAFGGFTLLPGFDVGTVLDGSAALISGYVESLTTLVALHKAGAANWTAGTVGAYGTVSFEVT
jgi:hypothetical protein